MLFALLYFGTFWFYAATIIPFLLLIAFVEWEKSGLAFWTIILTAAAFVAFGDPKIVPWILAHPIQIVEGIGIYIVAGVVWGFIKWFFYVLKQRDIYVKARAGFVDMTEKYYRDELARHNADSIKNPKVPVKPVFDKVKFEGYCQNMHGTSDFPPRAAKHKGKIIFWMSYFPFSALWTLIHDPITRFYRFLYRRIVGVFEAISNSMFKQFKDDLG